VIADLFSSGAPKGAVPLPLSVVQRLADLWTELGNKEGDEELLSAAVRARGWVQKLGSRARFLFYPEDCFFEEELQELGSSYEPFRDEFLSIECDANCCFTWNGWNTSLGSIQLGEVEIRAFGPQCGALTDRNGFGIALLQPAESNWTRVLGNREVWVQMIPTQIGLEQVRLDLKFAGLSGQETIWLAFYVKAKSCLLENGSQFFPRSLQRFQGRSQKILFDEKVSLESLEPLDFKLIPLAGSLCYWNSTFLTAFRFDSSMNRSSFVLNLI
jgi:hypothetical protein